MHFGKTEFNMHPIAVASNFSRFPGGRYREKGRHSGEEFRDDILIPALESHGVVIVQLDGTEGYGSSFLEETFGGLVRRGFGFSDLETRLQIVTNSPAFQDYVDESWQYIKEASQRMQT